MLAEKTRIAFQVRISFAAFSLKRRWVDGHVVLARRLDSWLAEAYLVGEQKHVARLGQPC